GPRKSASCNTLDHNGPVLRIIVMCGARAFRRNHQRAYGLFGCTLAPEEFALRRLQNALQYFTALRSLGIGYAHPRNVKTLLGIPLPIRVPNLERGLRDESQASPFEVRAQFENFGHRA